MREIRESSVPNRRLGMTVGVLVVALLAAMLVVSPAATANPFRGSDTLATFEGETIDLRRGWGDATVCVVDEEGTTCYRTREDADEALTGDSTEGDSLVTTMDQWCWVRLFSSTGYSGREVEITVKGRWVSLSNLGFDNQTSSYRIGSCNSSFTSLSNGGGTLYPGDTSAWGNASSMLSGWNNRVSSVRIH
jgi:hypothetical protein